MWWFLVLPGLIVAFVIAGLRGDATAMAAIAAIALAWYVIYIARTWDRQVWAFRGNQGVWQWPLFARVRSLRYLPPVLSRRQGSQMRWLFSNYFNQDRDYDFDDEDALIQDFLDEASAEDVAATRDAIDALLARDLSDEELIRAMAELYCYGAPATGIADWLRSVRERLEAKPATDA